MNNTQNFPDGDLARRLARKADEFDRLGGSPLELGQVLDRAGEIRRGRRMRATMAMAAAVLAIAVPTAMIAMNSADQKPPQPAPAPAPAKIDHSAINLDGLERGSRPHDGYAVDGVFKVGDEAIGLPVGNGTVAGVAPMKGGLMVAVNLEGHLTAYFVDEHGGTTGTPNPMTGFFAVSPDGNVAAFVRPDGTPMVVQADQQWKAMSLPTIPRGSGFEAVAVVGEDCSPEAVDTGCAVWVQSRGKDPESWLSTSEGVVDTVRADFGSIADVGGSLVDGMTEASDFGSCSAVVDIDKDRSLWKTCDHGLLSFSPDGDHLLGASPYYDGMGDSRVAVLDSRSGQVVLDLRTENEAVVSQRVWEDDTHVLATVYQHGQWAVVRIGLNGSRELAVPPVADSGDLVSPFVLASR